jgi:hypothetical protein
LANGMAYLQITRIYEWFGTEPLKLLLQRCKLTTPGKPVRHKYQADADAEYHHLNATTTVQVQ